MAQLHIFYLLVDSESEIKQIKIQSSALLSLYSIKFTDYIHQETTTGVGKTPLDKEQITLTPNCLTNKAGN